MAKLSRQELFRLRVNRVEDAALDLTQFVEQYGEYHKDSRRKALLEKAREYAAAIRSLGGRR